MKVFATSYFPSIYYTACMIGEKAVAIEAMENYPKQNLRNRCFIYSANGVQCLTLPVRKKTNPLQYTKDILIDYSSPWQRNHWRSLVSAYNSSPFFLHYSHYFEPFFNKKPMFLIDLNNTFLDVVLNKIFKLEVGIESTPDFQLKYENNEDLRYLCKVKNYEQPCDDLKFGEYYQVFANKFGFKQNLSIIDLIFNEGAAAKDYLKTLTRETC